MSVSLIDGHIDDDVQMTDKQIVKALEDFADILNGAICFRANERGAKEYYETLTNALDLINRQKAEILRLEYNIESLEYELEDVKYGDG